MCRFDTTKSAGVNIYFDTATVKNALFPNATVHPTSVSIGTKIRAGGLWGTAHIKFLIGGTSLGVDWTDSGWDEDTEYSQTFTGAAVTGCNKNSSLSANGYATSYDCYFRWVRYTFYFTRYDFSAVAGEGVSSVSVSAATGYDGDQITFTAQLADGYEFVGWYAGSTLVSTSQSYTHTVNGSDLQLTAISKRGGVPLYVKENGTYTQIQRVYKKINGVWIEQTDIPSLFPEGIRLRKA